MMSRYSKSDREAAVERLREWIKPGDTVQTILRHVSRSGMSRAISPVVNGQDISFWVARACDYTINQKHGGLKVEGCGMDMGFDVVYQLSYQLFKDGFDCIGEGCPANDHSNGDQVRTPHRHTDAGYALKQRWL